jgi:hypothetical protein
MYRACAVKYILFLIYRFKKFTRANQCKWVNPDIAAAIYCGLQTLAATLVSRFCSST